MKLVGKYNIFKGLSLAVSAGAPLTTAALISDFFVETTDTSISTAGVIALLICILVLKDKLLEQFKSPTAFKISAALLIIVLLIESIIMPMKYVLIAAVIALGADTIFLKRIYTVLESQLPEKREMYEHFGFIFCKTETLIGETTNESH